MSKKIVYYIAQSLDGYIASLDGSIDWLPQESMGEQLINSYQELLDRIDTVVMGRNTFDQITTILSPTIWPYEGLKSYIWTNRELNHPSCISIKQDIIKFVEEQKTQTGKDIWLVGGATFAHTWVENDLIDEYIVCTTPIILGEGIPLFKSMPLQINLELKSTIIENGAVQLHYIKK